MSPAVIPTVAQYMTPNPETIAPDACAKDALQKMRSLGVRHLPVRRLGEIVGIVSDRDLDALLADRDDPDCRGSLVADAMTPYAYKISPDTPLEEAATVMRRGKYGAALVMQNGRLVGMFTATDALQALADLARQSRRAS